VLLTRPPLASPRRVDSFDLHVLGTPPAFVLSQDQTLQSFDLLVEHSRLRVNVRNLYLRLSLKVSERSSALREGRSNTRPRLSKSRIATSLWANPITYSTLAGRQGRPPRGRRPRRGAAPRGTWNASGRNRTFSPDLGQHADSRRVARRTTCRSQSTALLRESTRRRAVERRRESCAKSFPSWPIMHVSPAAA
jgi:hypothetical protein